MWVSLYRTVWGGAADQPDEATRYRPPLLVSPEDLSVVPVFNLQARSAIVGI